MLLKLRSFLGASLVAALLVTGGASPARASALDEQNGVFALVNQERSARGSAPLIRDVTLDAVAAEYAALVVPGALVHSLPEWRAERIPAGWDANGENLASGQRDAATVMVDWMFSPDHRANILNPSYTRMGIAYDDVSNVWVQIFAGYVADRPELPVTSVPTISGVAQVGVTLRAAAGTWGPATVALSYSWLRAGVAITGATTASYKLTTADMGRRISVRVTGTEAGYRPASRTSAPTAAVLGTLTGPTPTIAGTTRVGYTLGATLGSWSPGPITFSYQWKRSGVAIAGATTSSHKLVSADLGRAMTVTVTGRKAAYATLSKTSVATAAVLTTFTAAPVPKISGIVKTGRTLTATAGTWSPTPVLGYQWKKAGVAIVGATARTYVVRATDVGRVITVAVTGKRASYVTVTKQSAATIPVVGLAYANCLALNAAYPHGVAKVGILYDRVSGVNRAFKGTPFFSTALYALNPARDGDKDGIACEK